MDAFQKFTNDEDYEAWRLLDHTRKLIFQLRSEELKKYDVTPVDISVLNRIQTLGKDATPIAIARLGNQTRSAIHEMLKKIEGKGFVSKYYPDKMNKKTMIVVLTQKGKKAYRNAKRVQSIHEVFSCLSPEEIQQLDKYLGKLWAKGNQVLNKEQYNQSYILY